MAEIHVLVVDDEPAIRNLVKEILEDEGYSVSTAENAQAARDARRQRKPDLVLMDVWMPDMDGISLLKEWSEDGSLPCPVIMISGHGTVETAVEATRLGAYEFIEKPISLAKLLLTVERAVQAHRLQEENIGLKKYSHRANDILGRSMVIQTLRDQAKKIAQHETWVLLIGEAGVGKQTFARFIHDMSNRREGPFIEVGVAAITKENAAQELFGSEYGGTVKYGRLEQANGGTLFLSEIADMDLEVQARLHSAFETGAFTRLGGSQEIRVNVRAIAATHKDLVQEVRIGRFREDLYYHLNVVPMKIPPLRDHSEDVPEFLHFFTGQFVDQENLPYRKFSMSAQNRLRNHGWPGNIRELKNLVQRLLILGTGEEISLDEVNAALGQQQKAAPAQGLDIDFELPLKEAREDFEKAYLLYHLRQSDGSVGKLAKLVGMERTHLYRKLRSLGIDPKNPLSDS